jgi:hypothetical protein
MDSQSRNAERLRQDALTKAKPAIRKDDAVRAIYEQLCTAAGMQRGEESLALYVQADRQYTAEKRATRHTTLPLERDEQRTVTRWLKAHGIRFNANLEGVNKPFWARVASRNAGMRRGRPDLEITSPVPGRPEIRGVALELKRQKPAGRSPTPEQVDELEALRNDGWVAEVHYGAESAIRWLGQLYGVRP